MKKMMRNVLFGLMCVCLVSMAQAAISSESFSGYIVGEELGYLTVNPAVSGYTGNWTDVDFGDAEPAIASGFLVYGGAGYISGTGNHVAKGADTAGIGAGNSGRAYRLLDASLSVNDTTTGTLYLSWLFKTGNENAAGNANTYQTLALYHNTGGAQPAGDAAQRIFDAGIAEGDFGTGNYAFRYNNTTTIDSGIAADSEVHLFVVKFVLSAVAGGDSMTVWLDPTLTGGEPVGEAKGTLTGLDFNFESLAFSDYASNSCAWDEVRWGTSFDDVTVVGSGIVNVSPVYGAEYVANARTSSDNDLVFIVFDENVTKVDVQFGPENDPNLTTKPAYKIVDDMAVTTGQYTVNLESLAEDLLYETTYYWKVIGYEPNAAPGATDYFEVPGQVWSFTTTPQDPLITLDPPAYTAVDAGEPEIVLSANGINGDFQWKKDGSPISDGADYAGTATNTLTIYDVQLADEGYYTLEVSNLIGIAESAPARVMIYRLTSHYPFELMNVVDGNDVTPDIVGGFDMTMTNEAASAGLPVLADANQVAVSFGKYLKFDNADHATDPNGQFALIANDVAKFEDITIGLWVNYNGGVEWQRIYDIGSTTTSFMALMPDAGGAGGLRFAITTGSGEQQVNAPALTVGEWTHVVVTIDGNTGRLYVNGELVDTNPNMTLNPIAVTQTRNYVGKSQFVDPEFNGLIDDLMIYNYARTSVEVAQDYANAMNVSVCNREGTAEMEFDTNDDCKIDIIDFAEFAADWLNDNRIYPQ